MPDTTNKNASKITNKCDLGTLLTDFFKFFGKQFDYEHMGISIRDTGSYFPKVFNNNLKDTLGNNKSNNRLHEIGMIHSIPVYFL